MDQELYSAYSEPMTLHALGGLVGSRRTLLYMQQRAASGRHDRYLELTANVTSKIRIHQSVRT